MSRTAMPNNCSSKDPNKLPAAVKALAAGPIGTIEWEMMDKKRFVPMSMASSFTVRCFLYPLMLVRTRLQVQYQNDVYRGTWDALRKIAASEGIRGLYRGFWVSCFQVVSGVGYVSTYEGVRHIMSKKKVGNNTLRAFVGGGCASVVGQTIIVPFDVISQHLMLLGQKNANTNMLQINTEGRTKGQIVLDVAKAVYQKDGLRGYYRGYTASLCTYVPSSASWWGFYHFFQDAYALVLPPIVPHLVLQCGAAMSSGCASCLITNPLDLVRTRVQVHRRTIPETIRWLWATEGVGIFTKGLTARMTSSVIYSVCIIFGYETVKRWSVYDEYKERVKW